MKKIGLALVTILAISMMLMVVAPVLAARTPKNEQVFVKVFYSTGKPAGKVAVMIYEGNDFLTTEAHTGWVMTKGNGMAVISLNKETVVGSWSSGMEFTVLVSTTYSFEGYTFYPNTFFGTLSANIQVTIPPPP